MHYFNVRFVSSHSFVLGLMLLVLVGFSTARNRTAANPPTTGIIQPTSAVIVTAAPTVATTLVPTATPVPTLVPSATPPPTLVPLAAITGYHAYVVQTGDTLAAIARRGGSDAELLRRYNRLNSEPQAKRELIVPQINGQSSELLSSNLLVFRGNTSRRVVALTFNCEGTNPISRQVVEILNAANVRVTFFLLGTRISEDGELLAALVAGDHELASHGATHVDYREWNAAEIAADLEREEAAVREVLGSAASLRPFFRFPYGYSDERTTQIAIDNGYLPINWTLDLLDTVSPPKTAAYLVERATNTLPPDDVAGAIILAHCTPATVEALPTILQIFADQGITVSTISDVLSE